MTVKLPEEMSINTAPGTRTSLLAALQAEEALVLDGAAVTTVDLAGLQLLCAAHRSAAQAGKSVTFAEGARSAELDRAAAVGGFHGKPGCSPGCLWQVR